MNLSECEKNRERSREQALAVILANRTQVIPSSSKMTTTCCLHWWS